MTNATVIDEQHAYLQLQGSANNLGGDFTAAEANARVEVDALIALLTFVLLRFMCVCRCVSLGVCMIRRRPLQETTKVVACSCCTTHALGVVQRLRRRL